MICSNIHNNRVVLWGFDLTKCTICGCEITTAHTPGNVVCPKCSEDNGLCEICGEKIKKGEGI